MEEENKIKDESFAPATQLTSKSSQTQQVPKEKIRHHSPHWEKVDKRDNAPNYGETSLGFNQTEDQDWCVGPNCPSHKPTV
ncbi:hypothetical protein ABK040_005168 [Willaertia magna]